MPLLTFDLNDFGITVAREGEDLVLTFDAAPGETERWTPAPAGLTADDDTLELLQIEGRLYVPKGSVQ